MKRTYEIDGSEWAVTVDRQAAHPGMHAIVFHCVSDGQRPYRVLEVPADSGTDPDRLSERELRELFGNAHTLDFSLDEAAEPRTHGQGDRHY
jgi:hypothetical protein